MPEEKDKMISKARLEQVVTKIKSEISGGGSGDPLPTSKGGTGNTTGYIRTGQKSGTSVGNYATIEGHDNEASGNYSHAEGSGTKATGTGAHAEGGGFLKSTEATGNYSHAEGEETKATANGSHSEGYKTVASGSSSHAEGQDTNASGSYSHSEGKLTKATGDCAHAEGFDTTAKEYCHAEGYHTFANGHNSHAEGNGTKAEGEYSHTEGHNSKTIGNSSHAEGQETLAHGDASHAEGEGTITNTYAILLDPSKQYNDLSNVVIVCKDKSEVSKVASGDKIFIYSGYNRYETTIKSINEKNDIVINNSGDAYGAPYMFFVTEKRHLQTKHAHAEGDRTSAIGTAAHSEGSMTLAQGNYSHAEGQSNLAIGETAHAEGYVTKAIGQWSHAEGGSTVAEGHNSHAAGLGTITKSLAQYAIGQYNREMGDEASNINTDAMFIIGKGELPTSRANCFRVGHTSVWGGTYQSSGADYAEMFEWADGNPENEDRVGRFVTMKKGKIRYASNQDYILGITSAAPSVCGDTYDDQWQGMFETDIFGRPIYEDVTVPAVMSEDGQTVLIPARIEHRQKLNPHYKSTEDYQGRSSRKEWAAVGIVGKLVMLQDGTLSEDDFVSPGENGIATRSDTPTNCIVMKVIDNKHIQVFIK